MRVIESLCDLQGDPITVAVFSDVGVKEGKPNLAINDLLHGITRGTADKWLKTQIRDRAGVVKTLHPYPVDETYEPVEPGKQSKEGEPAVEAPKPIVGYVSLVHFKK